MNSNGPAGSIQSPNLNEQMQVNDSEEIPNVQPPLRPQNTMPPDDYVNANMGAQNTGMPAGFEANSAANVEAAAAINPAFNEFQLQNVSEEEAIRLAMAASMQHGSDQNQAVGGQPIQSDMNTQHIEPQQNSGAGNEGQNDNKDL